MAAQSEIDVAGTEIEAIESKVPTLFDRDDTCFTKMEKVQGTVVSNRDMRVPLEMNAGGKAGQYNPDAGDMGRGGGPSYDKGLINVTHQRFGVEYTALSDFATATREQAVIQNVRTLVSKATAQFRRYHEALLMTAGNGALATVTSVSVGGGVGGTDRVTCSTDGYRVKLLYAGQDFNVYNAAFSTNRTAGAERTIVGTPDLQNFTFDHSLPTVAGMIATDRIVISGVSGANPVSLLGVPYHYSNAATGTWLGLNRANFPQIRANRVNAGGALALSFARRAINMIGDRVGLQERMTSEAWMHPAQKHAYEQLGQLVSQIHKQAKPEGLNLYFGDDMQLAGCPVKESYFWDRTRIDFMDFKNWARVEMRKTGFYEVGGQRIFPIRGGSGGLAASSIFYLVSAPNTYVRNPAKAAYIDGLTIPTGY